jgi:hypothetical protein
MDCLVKKDVGTAHIRANVTVTAQVSLLSNDCLFAVAKQL